MTTMIRRLTVVLCLTAWITPAARAAEEPQVVPDVVYGHKDGLALTFDVIKPEKPNGAGILWIQSGGWYSNWTDPKPWPTVAKPFLDKGYTVFIVRHGSAPKYAIPEVVEDVRRSVRFIRMRSKDFNVDPERLGVMGECCKHRYCTAWRSLSPFRVFAGLSHQLPTLSVTPPAFLPLPFPRHGGPDR